jgi:hypothetical protein
MPSVIRSVGDLKHAKNVDGEEVHRSEYLTFHGHLTPCLNTDNHFIYRSRRIGSALLCTCGGEAVSAGYHAYKKYASFMGSEVLICRNFFQNGRHADGST